jgi:TonB-dependent receptor
MGSIRRASRNHAARYFRDLSENNRNEKIDLTIPFRNWDLDDGELKLGLFDSFSEREFLDRGVEYGMNQNEVWDGNLRNFLTPANLGYTSVTQANDRIDYTWGRYISGIRESFYEGEAGVQAAYLMLDTPVVNKLRLVGGVRLESTDIKIHSESDVASSWTGLTTNDSKIAQSDILPAAGLIWSIKPDMNLRAHFSKTIARPSFRELAAYRSYDPILDDLLDGNPNLQMTSINNYDLRWEWFFNPGEILSVSLFYKSLRNAIERKYLDVNGSLITFDNRKEGTVYGIEFETRKNLGFIDPSLSLLTVGGNLSLIGSKTELTDDEFSAKQSLIPDTDRTRQLYDQSPYILNLDLTYDNPHSGTTAGLIFNMAGPRITIASLNTEDVFEQPAPGLDFILSQKLGRNLSLKFNVKNILDPKVERTYGKEGKLIYSSYKRGRAYGFSMSYDF